MHKLLIVLLHFVHLPKNADSIEERFAKLKKDFEVKIADLTTKLTCKIEFTHRCKQDLIKLTNENMNLNYVLLCYGESFLWKYIYSITRSTQKY